MIYSLVIPIDRFFVGEAVGSVVTAYGRYRAERATEIFSACNFVSPQIAQILGDIDEGDVTLYATVEAADNVNGIGLGIGVGHRVSIGGRRWISNDLHVFGDQSYPEIARVLIGD